MTPNKKEVINGKTIEQFYWAGEFVTYVDNRLHWGTFENATEEARQVTH